MDRKIIGHKVTTALLLAMLLTGCGGESDAPEARTPPSVPLGADNETGRLVTGGVTKGVVKNADVSFFTLDEYGFDLIEVESTVTGDQGDFSVELTATVSEPVLVQTFGGSFVDESDQALTREIQLDSADGFKSVLLEGATVVAVNPFTDLLVNRARLLSAPEGDVDRGTDFLSLFIRAKNEMKDVTGFDMVETIPANPVAPASDATSDEKQYALLLGGLANAINNISIELGLAEPTYQLIEAVTYDLVDGLLDGKMFDQVLQVDVGEGSGDLPGNINFDLEVIRFRNNNFDNYSDTTVPSINLGSVFANNTPSAHAGPDQIVGEATDTTLDGTGSSDPDGGLIYFWTQTSGSPVALDDATLATPAFTAPLVSSGVEELVFALLVSDPVLALASDTVMVTVSASPVAKTGPDQSVEQSSVVNLNGTSSNVAIGSPSFLWTQTSGTSVVLDDETLATPSFTAPVVSSGVEELIFTLLISDPALAQASDTVTVNVSASPVANAGADQSIEHSGVVILNGASSNVATGSPSFLWTQTSGTTVVLDDATLATPSFTAPLVSSGVEALIFTLSVSDPVALASDAVTVTVSASPVANAGADQSVERDGVVNLSGASSNVAIGSPTFLWTQTSGTAVVLDDATLASPSFTAPVVSVGSEDLTFSVTIADQVAATDSDEVVITVVSFPPQSDAGSDISVGRSETVILDGSVSTAETGATYAWTQTTGTTMALSDASTVSPTFTAPQTLIGTESMEFELLLTDSLGRTASDSVAITVKGAIPFTFLAVDMGESGEGVGEDLHGGVKISLHPDGTGSFLEEEGSIPITYSVVDETFKLFFPDGFVFNVHDEDVGVDGSGDPIFVGVEEVPDFVEFTLVSDSVNGDLLDGVEQGTRLSQDTELLPDFAYTHEFQVRAFDYDMQIPFAIAHNSRRTLLVNAITQFPSLRKDDELYLDDFKFRDDGTGRADSNQLDFIWEVKSDGHLNIIFENGEVADYYHLATRPTGDVVSVEYQLNAPLRPENDDFIGSVRLSFRKDKTDPLINTLAGFAGVFSGQFAYEFLPMGQTAGEFTRLNPDGTGSLEFYFPNIDPAGNETIQIGADRGVCWSILGDGTVRIDEVFSPNLHFIGSNETTTTYCDSLSDFSVERRSEIVNFDVDGSIFKGLVRVSMPSCGTPDDHSCSNQTLLPFNFNVGIVTRTPLSDVPPTAAFDAAQTAPETPVTIDVLDNDVTRGLALDPASVVIVNGPFNGSAFVNGDGLITYTPDENAVHDTIQYRVRDTAGNESTVGRSDIVIAAPPPNLVGQVLLGFIVGATVEVFDLSDPTAGPVYTTVTTDNGDLDDAGLFEIPNGVIVDTELYVIRVSGGQGVDSDDDGVRDINPVPFAGVIRAMGLGSDFKGQGFIIINALTEVAYQTAALMVASGYGKDAILEQLDIAAQKQLNADIDSNGFIDRYDLTAFNSIPDAFAYKRGAQQLPLLKQGLFNNTLPTPEIASHGGAELGKVALSGFPESVVHVGGFAYVANGPSGLRIIDTSVPGAPVEVGAELSGTNVVDVEVIGNIAYAVDSYDSSQGGSGLGLMIIDVSDPSSPQLINNHDAERLLHVTVVNDRAYLVDGSVNGLIVDLSDTALASTTFDLSGSGQDLVFDNGILFVAEGLVGFETFDLSVADAPESLAELQLVGFTSGVIVQGGIAYFLGDTNLLDIVDVTDPAVPQLRASFSTSQSGMESATIDGTLLYFSSMYKGLQVIDVSDPSFPQFVGFPGVPAVDVAIANGLAYVINDTGLHVMDILDPRLPANLIGIYETINSVEDIEVFGTTAFIALAESGLEVVDVSDPGAFSRIGGAGSGASGAGISFEVSLMGDKAYVADGPAGLTVYDVSDLSAPFEESVLTLGSPSSVQVIGTTAYLADGTLLVVVDILTSPQVVGTPIEVAQTAYTMDVVDDKAYVLGATSLEIFNVGSTPFSMGDFVVGDGYDIKVIDTVAYIANGAFGFLTVDVSDPAAPEQLGSIYMPDFANAVFVDNNIAYVAGGLSGVVLFDVTDPALPFPLGSYNPLTPVFSVEVDNGVVYVGGTDKLSTFRAPVLRRSDMLFDRPPAN